MKNTINKILCLTFLALFSLLSVGAEESSVKTFSDPTNEFRFCNQTTAKISFALGYHPTSAYMITKGWYKVESGLDKCLRVYLPRDLGGGDIYLFVNDSKGIPLIIECGGYCIKSSEQVCVGKNIERYFEFMFKKAFDSDCKTTNNGLLLGNMQRVSVILNNFYSEKPQHKTFTLK